MFENNLFDNYDLDINSCDLQGKYKIKIFPKNSLVVYLYSKLIKLNFIETT